MVLTRRGNRVTAEDAEDAEEGTVEGGTELTERVIRSAIAVHRALGPGLLESTYEACLVHELMEGGVALERQKALPVHYRGLRIDCGYRVDLLVGGELIVELKAVERLLPIHDAQLLTYLRLSDLRVGLLLNFNTTLMRNGIKRIVNAAPSRPPT
jgi:GxxExxY protein